MPDIPDYVSSEREISVVVETPDRGQKQFKTSYGHVRFIDVRKDGVWIRDENEVNTFYPSDKILEVKMGSSPAKIPEELQKQRRK
ncbi:hypothetical protein ACK3SF_02965 [Candidatus Nanosalina sp. VS9-1]|uniref:hypothetical protein n=1 Tax=Candidatus Nanosalina sp. VS9-1 TaxID=3388566 RepID=UPI0039E0C728